MHFKEDVLTKWKGNRHHMLAEKIYAASAEVSCRNTRPRRLIAERLIELAASGADFTIDDLWQELRQEDPHLGRATVYRSVEKLSTLAWWIALSLPTARIITGFVAAIIITT